MNVDQASHDRNCAALIDALLLAAYVDEQAAVANRVDRVMQRIGLEKSTPLRPPYEPNHATHSTWSRWVSLVIAASLLGAAFIGLQYVGPTQRALAAIEQSLEAAEEKVARKYLITVTRKEGMVSREIENDLYVEGNDRFALRHPTLLPGADLWLGKNGDTNWVVPVIGPVLTGNDLALSRWLSVQEQFSTPYLHVTTVLDRMSRGYRLWQLGESTVHCVTGKDVLCRHVLGELKREADQNLPATIELWSDAESGVAIRIEARWSLSASDSGRERVVIEFADQPDLPDNWFEAEGHYSGLRSKITFDRKEKQ
jgi:hypothetical protein